MSASLEVGEQQAWPYIASNTIIDNSNGHACVDPEAHSQHPVRGGRLNRWSSHQAISSRQGTSRPQRICGVCGDKARSLHFGGLSCDSCKAFFRRAVQSTAYKNFQCPHQSSGWSQFCVINVSSRKSCQKCRFERCVQIGMEISWVMSEAERQRLLNARHAKRRKLESVQTFPTSSTSPSMMNKPLQDYLWPLKPECVNLSSILTQEEANSVQEVKHAWTDALQQLPPTPLDGVDLRQELDHALIIRSMAGSVQRFQLFATPLLQASVLLEEDKKSLVQGSMLEMCILRGALNHVRGATLFERYFPARLHEIHCRFVKGLTELALDQTTLLLFLMIILMNPERSDLIEPNAVEKIQDYYLAILNKYINGRYGAVKAAGLYPKLLSKMADLRELSDCHQEQNLTLARHEVKTMKLELNRIQQPETCFEPPQKFVIGHETPQLSPERPISPNNAFRTHHQDYHPISPITQIKPLIIPSAYTSVQTVSSPCDSVVSSSSSQRFFPQTPPFTESSSEDFYMQMGSFEDKDHDQFIPSFLCLQTTQTNDVEVVRISDCITTRTQADYEQFCLPVDHKTNYLNGAGRCQFHEPPAGVYEHFPSLDKTSEGFLFGDECQAFVQQCLQDGTLLSPSVTNGRVESY